MNSLIGILDFTKIMIDSYQDQDGVAVDMACGRGNDTIYLQDRFRKVYAFDIQKEAVLITQERVNLDKVVLINDNHENIDNYIHEKIKLVIYNLGYLPKINEEITTNAQTTINSLSKTLKLLEKKGIVIMVVYTGHLAGKQEALLLDEFLAKLSPSEYLLAKYQMLNAKDCPYVICIHKK